MSYLNINSDILRNSASLLEKEVLLTNSYGCCYNTTLGLCNTRKYHGALVVPQRQIDNENHVLLSAMAETIIYKDEQYGLGSMMFAGDTVLPNKRIGILSADVSPTLQYTFGTDDLRIRKTVLLLQDTPQLMFCYHVLETSLPLVLRLQPFFAFRNIHHLAKRNHTDKAPGIKNVGNGIRVQKSFDYSNVYLQSSQPPMFSYSPDWWYNVYYPCEKERGYDCYEDLYTPGTMEYALHSGDILYFSASLMEVEPYLIRSKFNKELAHRKEVTSFSTCLQAAAKQFVVVDRDRKTHIKAGYPWFGYWGRDTFISLPGISLAVPDATTRVLESIKGTLNQGLFPNIASQGRNSYNGADTSLWFFWALQYYAKATKLSKRVWNKYGNVCKEILKCYKNGTLFSIRADENGLLWQGEEGRALTWMDAVVDGKPVTQRKGYAVEINALWYNAISFSIEMATYCGDEKFVDEWIDIASNFPKYFQAMFWNEDYGYLADCVTDENKDFSIRPNMLFAVSLPYSPIDERMRKMVVDKVEHELLTPKGLRTLSSSDINYCGHCIGSQAQRDGSYHQGTVWPWLSGAFVDAYLRVYGTAGLSFVRSIYMAMENTVKERCIGSVSEIYDGDMPHTPRGAVAQAWSVAELLRMKYTIDNYKE
ncbi:MAG: glycogen debranching enzyme family protein [Bacteroidales bacterium]|nr:glycogen debranching enzyme family protein [Bacteroidales bacterium]